jgi:hypothetical protein
MLLEDVPFPTSRKGLQFDVHIFIVDPCRFVDQSSFTSVISLSASPRKLYPRTVRLMAIPGKVAIHEAPSMKDLPAPIRDLRVADGVFFFLKIRNEAFHLQYLYNDGPIRKSPSDRGESSNLPGMEKKGLILACTVPVAETSCRALPRGLRRTPQDPVVSLP